MTMAISSGGMRIVASGEVFLFDSQVDVLFCL